MIANRKPNGKPRLKINTASLANAAIKKVTIWTCLLLFPACVPAASAAEPNQQLVGHIIPFKSAGISNLQTDSLEEAFGKAIANDKDLQSFLDKCEGPYKEEAGGGYKGRNVRQVTIASSVSRDTSGLNATDTVQECIALYISFNLGHRQGIDQVAGFFIICNVTAISKRHYKDDRDDAGAVVSLKIKASIADITNALDTTARYAKISGW